MKRHFFAEKPKKTTKRLAEPEKRGILMTRCPEAGAAERGGPSGVLLGNRTAQCECAARGGSAAREANEHCRDAMPRRYAPGREMKA
jgi:hypothetical protein